MMLDDKREKLSQELAEKRGPRTRDALHQLNELIADTISQRDLLGFGFVAEATARLMNHSLDMAKAVQSERGPMPWDTLN